MEGVLVELGSWGRRYRGDFIGCAFAFLIPLLITWALKGFYDIVTLTSLCGFIFCLTPLILSKERLFTYLLSSWRKTKYQYPINIGILNGYLTDDRSGKLPNRPYTEYKPIDWYKALSSSNEFNVSWALATEISRKFDIIINPFGEEYPEIDKPNLATLRKITQFVKDGGVFVNVAGLAFYYLWDGEKEDITGPLYETYQLNRIPGLLQRKVLLRVSHLLDSSLYRRFGIRTTFFSDAIIPVRAVSDEFFKDLDKVGGALNVHEFRSAYRSEREEATLIPLLKAEYIIQDPRPIAFECYPIAAVRFDRGYLIINGMKLERARPQDFEKAVEAIKRIARKLNLKGVL